MTVRLMNSAMMPAEGVYVNRQVSEQEFADLVVEAVQSGRLISYIGYEQTAAHICDLTGVDRLGIPVNRSQTVVDDGDVLLICKLAYRLSDPSSKGREQKPEWEYFSCSYHNSLQSALRSNIVPR